MADLIPKITLPCMIFSPFNKPLAPEVLIQTTLILVVTSCISILPFFLGKATYNRYPPERKNILQCYTLVNNSGFLGAPMVAPVYGNDGLFAASILIIPNRILIWTAELSVFTTADLKTKCRNILLNPCIVTVSLGLARQISEFPVPGFPNTAIANVDAVISSFFMMVIGIMLISVPWKKLSEPSLFRPTFVHLVALPLVVLVILDLIRMEPILAGISLALTGMPTGNTSAPLAAKYEADEDYVSRCTVIATLLSPVIIPLLMLLL